MYGGQTPIWVIEIGSLDNRICHDPFFLFKQSELFRGIYGLKRLPNGDLLSESSTITPNGCPVSTQTLARIRICALGGSQGQSLSSAGTCKDDEDEVPVTQGAV